MLNHALQSYLFLTIIHYYSLYIQYILNVHNSKLSNFIKQK